MSTGENEQALRKIIDFTRMGSLILLAFHFYIACYGAFLELSLQHPLLDKIIGKVAAIDIFQSPWQVKSVVLGLLIISLIGAKGRKDDKIQLPRIIRLLLTGLALFYGGIPLLAWHLPILYAATIYITSSMLGYILVLTGGTLLSRLIKEKLSEDLFNIENESFPQQEECITNEYSFNFPARYYYKGKQRHSWVNIISPFRSTLVLGSPGSGKSFFVINNIIKQSIRKGYATFIYDLKFPDLSLIAYNTLRTNSAGYQVPPTFFAINFDDLSRSHRCNPLEPSTMTDITDASDSSRSIMMGLNREWARKNGDFFVESPINFLTGIIWFLRKYADGKYCTLPHAIEMLQASYDDLFPVLRTEDSIEALINPFVSAYVNNALAQLEGQIASAKIGLARLVSPQLYYVLTGNDFSLDLNDPVHPKIICIGNNPSKQQVYGPIISLYVTRLLKRVNRKGMTKSSLIFDEYSSIYAPTDNVIAQARSNLCATTLGLQDYSQLKKDYGTDQAEVVMNIVGNVISGQVNGDTARQLSDRFGRIMQQRVSKNINSADISYNYSGQLDNAIPASKIATLSSGHFVGIVSDLPSQKIEQKMFHCEILNDMEALKKEEASYVPIPIVKEVSEDEIELNYINVKLDVRRIIDTVLTKIKADPGLQHLLIRK
ncbi:Type IV secretory system Conjugative DNA transfer [Chitinophaga costaii]|uniref:Type IV secretory system Conjugative DNA transfer n=1 Tax=Chitinophaga costaii TaxID=1335309 RepID=A0A1C4EW15_9BACT|nr:conjugal transfer protein MobC [Chitinophaga costaii]PUZ21609.1 conjugal transfer protein TraG [Chitinophaga costaii]SCC47797.1 Type IV secretory system Conjugative DNA transfer [Chitinophaga costaii]